MIRCWQFDLDLKTTGQDIESRFPDCKVSNIKEIDDPLDENSKVKK